MENTETNSRRLKFPIVIYLEVYYNILFIGEILSTILYNTKSNFVPSEIRSYYLNHELTPADKYFYGPSPIKSVAIRIFSDKPLAHAGVDKSYPIRRSSVILTTDTQVTKIGLHLFPVMRVKRPLPLVELHIKDKDGKITPLHLPEIQRRQLTEYLENGKPHLNFTGSEFLCFLFDLPETLGSYNFTTLPFNLDEIVPGDAVVLYGHDNDYIHEALYLGMNLYLWHCDSSCVGISTYEEMVATYGVASVEMLRPIETQRPIQINIHNTEMTINDPLFDYFDNKSLIPKDQDFYRGVASIETAEIEIDLNRRILCNPDEDNPYEIYQAQVIFTTCREILRMGAHLFPTMRVKRRLPDIRIVILDAQGQRKLLTLAQPILRNLSRYLEEGKPDLKFYCFHFVHYLLGLPLHPALKPFKFFPAEQIIPGEAIVLYNEEKPVHMALCISRDLYIWHLGGCGIMISDLKGLKDAYPSQEIKIAQIKSRGES